MACVTLLENKIKKPLGFTLIELLVVISIISLLSSVIIASLNSVRSKARDSKRIQDLTNIQTALELYYNTYGGYPASRQVSFGVDSDSCVNVVEGPGSLGNPYLLGDAYWWCSDVTSLAWETGTPVVGISNGEWIPGLGEFMKNMPHAPNPRHVLDNNGLIFMPYIYSAPLFRLASNGKYIADKYILLTALENDNGGKNCDVNGVYWCDKFFTDDNLFVRTNSSDTNGWDVGIGGVYQSLLNSLNP